MKKIGLILLAVILLVTGCGKTDKNSVLNDFKAKVNKSKSYELKGIMEIINDEDIFKYTIETKYLNDDDSDYYKVTLINQTNNHEQIILKNEEGVYVVTPSLNKSFKFQSNWPNNSSQSYLLASILSDITNDSNSEFEEKDGYYIIKNKVNYPNNEELTYEKVYFDKDATIKRVEVYNNKDMMKIKVEFTTVNMKASLDDDDFELAKLITEPECSGNCNQNNNKSNINENANNNENSNFSNSSDTTNENNSTNTTETTNENNSTNTTETTSLEDIIYPLYVPENTSLKSKDVISTEDGERVILTFAGDSSFVLVEETMNASDEFEIIPVYGDPEIINDSIGALSANSLSWTSNNVSYYLTGTTLAKEELISIATSMNNVGVVNAEK